MDKKDDNSPSNLWTRRSNSSKLGLAVNKSDHNDNATPSAKRYGSFNAKNNPFNAVNAPSNPIASPTTSGASSAFGLGTGAFASFGGAAKTPKGAGTAFDFSKSSVDNKKETQSSYREEKEQRRPPVRQSPSSTRVTEPEQAPAKDTSSVCPLKHSWVIYYRPPTSKNSNYEKSMKPLCRMDSVQSFWTVYSHMRRPSTLPTVSDYHFFKEGIRPVWEDDENRRGGKWIMRLKKGVADRYWEDLILAMIGDQFAEASEEVCGAVVSVRSGEDVFSIWTKNDGGRNIKIRETIKRILALPNDTNLQWRSHDESITQRNAVDEARQAKATYGERRRSTLTASSANPEKDRSGKEEAT